MTVYNGEKFLRQAVDSILAQTFDDWELIVVDDGSDDSTPDILLSYRDLRIKVLRAERNCKQAVCSNRALSIAAGRYIARLDADDVSLPNRLAIQARYMEAHPEVALVGSAGFEINGEGARIGFRPGELNNCSLKFTLAALNPIIHSSVMFRTDAARKLSGYNEGTGYWFSEDYEFLSRIAFCGRAIVLTEPLIEYRVHPVSVSACNVRDQSRQADRIARAALERILSREVNDSTWSAWRRFTMTRPGRQVAFDNRDVRSLSLLVPEMIRNVQHDVGERCAVPWLWARHSMALALSSRNRISARVRTRFMLMAVKTGAQALVAHRRKTLVAMEDKASVRV
jgi:glycosyltransferase involved in cell wall biosynthesis